MTETHPIAATLLELLELERLELRLFRGRNEQHGGPRLFGGQVLAQALRAACATVEGALPHSLHGYFLRPGKRDLPVVYEVDLLRDGRSFGTRRVVAVQNGEAIFTMAVSFRAIAPPADDVEWSIEPPAWPLPDALRDDAEIAREREGIDPNVMPWQTRARPFEIRSVYPFGDVPEEGPVKPAWLRFRGRVGDDPVLHRCLLAYASDMGLMSTSLIPHLGSTSRSEIIGASLDHAIWFHDDFRVDDWLLYDRDCPITGNARGFNRGRVFDSKGRYVATMTQEALLRLDRAVR